MCGANTYVNLPSLSEKAGEGLLSTYVWSLLSQRSEHIREPAFSLREGRFTYVWSEHWCGLHLRESVCVRDRERARKRVHIEREREFTYVFRGCMLGYM